jgi:hypothetical protein
MDAFDIILLVIAFLTCLAVWGSIGLMIGQHRTRVRMIREKHMAYQRKVKLEVEQQIREFSGDMSYELGGEIHWQRDEKGG